MHGHLPIIAMRKTGIAPKIVFVNDFPCQTSRDWHNPGAKYGELWPADHATISTAGDSISSLDLRFLVGLTVSITTYTESRAKAIFEKAKHFGAKTVAATSLETGWTDVFHVKEQARA